MTPFFFFFFFPCTPSFIISSPFFFLCIVFCYLLSFLWLHFCSWLLSYLLLLFPGAALLYTTSLGMYNWKSCFILFCFFHSELEPHVPEPASTDQPQMSNMEEQDNPSFTEDEVFGNNHSPRPAANTNGIRPDVMIEVSNSSATLDNYRNQSSSTLADIDVDTPGNSPYFHSLFSLHFFDFKITGFRQTKCYVMV